MIDMEIKKLKAPYIKRLLSILLLAGALALSHDAKTYAGGFLSPGDLSSLHESVSGVGKCEKCHSKFGLTNGVCLECHKEITAAVNTLKGYHAKISAQKCEECHGDHKGAEFTMVEWDKKNFDHSGIGYDLTGGHKKTDCEKCHKTRTKAGFYSYLGLSGEKCVECHADKHKGEFKEPCEKCHNTETWTGKNLTFDHNKSEYALAGKHKTADCYKCHLDSKKTGSFEIKKYSACDAVGCHDVGKFGNVHASQFKDQKCEKCHGLSGFKPSSFKHEDVKYVGYKLLGKHEKTACAKCHRTDPKTKVALYKPMKTSACDSAGCHDVKERGYVHGDQFKGQKCEKCHDEKGWKPAKFGHNDPKFIGFKLKGKHEKVQCVKCHPVTQPTKISLYRPINVSSCDAAGCHDVKERGNIHGAQFKEQRCDKCHTAKDWKYEKNLHTYTKFKLVRWHLKPKCDGCHKNKGAWTDLKDATCATCHYDPHKGTFAGGDNGCEPCHGFFRLAKERVKDKKTLNYTIQVK